MRKTGSFHLTEDTDQAHESPGVVYLDNNATTRALPEVRDAVANALDGAFGNPSSAHSAGDIARRKLFESRESVADLVGAQPEQVFFTSGATEANNIVLQSALHWVGAGGIVTTSIEHSSVIKCCDFLEERGLTVSRLAPNRGGWVEAGDFEDTLAQQLPRIVAAQWVNNETGVIQSTEQIGEICRRYGVAFLCDAAQAAGRIEIDFSNSEIDFLTISAHKLHGPCGVGALVAKDPSMLVPLLYGGDQEHGLRPGTENFAGIVGFGVAARRRKATFGQVKKKIERLRNRFERQLLRRFPFISINGDQDRRVWNTTNLGFRGLDGQALMARLDNVGVLCSQSSACTNARPEPSYVLRAMGLSEEEAYASIRFAFSELNTDVDVDLSLARIAPCVESLAAVIA